ncbi:hypothetical protein GLYMA_13G340400v4 [Glycine max]|nr:hypothetical protein GLYMA_13G340400v4 [Glycine max]KAG4384750.1 hypothetical protein GLYMA_13G340400v4 [Glycine max]KAG4384751.1 hypothetical protein GLYMA_13G340400v4 [Glycine max]KAG4384753.1 hypothetical protein GLYMA_13G340400v4 [Glycine max]
MVESVNSLCRFTIVCEFALHSAEYLLLSRQIEFKMSWNPCMEVRYNNISYPYSAAGTFIEYVEGLTYEHVNFIFSGASHAQVREDIIIIPMIIRSFGKIMLILIT